jgi:hypothetical protein
MADVTPPSTVTLRAPSQYLSEEGKKPAAQFAAPPLPWLCRTWSVTHSTLSMWRSTQNVRITYKALPGDNLDDLVEYEKSGSVKTVQGIDRPDPSSGGSWNWRGKGWLRIASSHWEVLSWGERQTPNAGVERWVITWFAPTLFTKEGLDIYSDQPGGLSKETLDELMAGMAGLSDAPKVVDLVKKEMREVAISLPWKTKDGKSA